MTVGLQPPRRPGMATLPPLIALLTDFGLHDWYAASMKAVLLNICPRARLVDITHDIPPQDVVAGAITLAASAPWFPPSTIFACVVDPGVGSDRPLLAAQADRAIFIGPDNGLLGLVLERATQRQLVRLTNPRYWLPEISQTFHGRDIIAPVAAHVARGCPLRRLGVPVVRYHTLRLPALHPTATSVRGGVVYVDRFGNLITNLPAALVKPPSHYHLRYQRRRVRLVLSYHQGRPGELIALAGSSGYLELAVPGQSAAERYRGRRGDAVRLYQGA